MLAQTFLSFSYFKVAVLHVYSRILKGITLTLSVYFCTSHSLFNPLQSGFCSQHSAKSAIMMKVTKEFLIPISNEHDFSWYCWNSILFIYLSSFLFVLFMNTFISFPQSVYLCFTEFPRPTLLLNSQTCLFLWHEWPCIYWFPNLLFSDQTLKLRFVHLIMFAFPHLSI